MKIIAALLVGLAAGLILGLCWRPYTIVTNDAAIVRMNTITGRAWFIYQSKWQLIHEPWQAPSSDTIVR